MEVSVINCLSDVLDQNIDLFLTSKQS